MNEVARGTLSTSEVHDKLEWLLHNYQKHLELHRMKTDTSTFETVVVTAADLLENIAKLNLGKVAKGLFSIRHRKISLMEAELTAPGNEVAFITKARTAFT